MCYDTIVWIIAGGMTAVSSSSPISGTMDNPFLCSHPSGAILPGETQLVTFTYVPHTAGLVIQPLRFVTTPPLPSTSTNDDTKRSSSSTDGIADSAPAILLRGIAQQFDEGSVRRKEILAQLNRYAIY
jgi:hypothetical protein